MTSETKTPPRFYTRSLPNSPDTTQVIDTQSVFKIMHLPGPDAEYTCAALNEKFDREASNGT